MVTLRQTVGFLGETVAGIAITLVLTALLWTVFGTLGVAGVLIFGFAGLLPLLPVLAYAPFVVTPAYGLLKRRYGFVVGPIILGLVCYTASARTVRDDAAQIAALTPPAVALARRDHAVFAIEGALAGCSEDCMNTLPLTGRIIARRDGTPKEPYWILYKAAEGEICRAADNAVLALELLKLGHVGKCVVQEKRQTLDDALVFRTRQKSRPVPDLPERFVGNVFELLERTAGEERLLARRMVGGFEPTLPLLLATLGKRPDRVDAGPRIEFIKIIDDLTKASAVGLSQRRQPFPLKETLEAIESYLGRQEIVEHHSSRHTIKYLASQAWDVVIGNERRADPEIGPSLVLKLLSSDDPDRIAVALRSLQLITIDQRAFVDQRLYDLLFEPKPIDRDKLLRMWRSRFTAGAPASEVVREKARLRVDDPALDPEQRAVLQQLAAP